MAALRKSDSVLNTPVLALNAVWYPINLVTAARALCMLFDGSAKAIDKDYTPHDFSSWMEVESSDGPWVNTTKAKIAIPEVVVLTSFDRVPKSKAKFSRSNIYRRDGSTCGYCGKRFPRSSLTIDHILPKSKGGRTSWGNCTASCLPCNAQKADRTPKEAGLRLIHDPYEPEGRAMVSMLISSRSRGQWAKFLQKA